MYLGCCSVTAAVADFCLLLLLVAAVPRVLAFIVIIGIGIDRPQLLMVLAFDC